MATKKQGGGSNIGLIITLVFFVLTTVILGVTTYLGYSEQEANTKKVKDAEAKTASMTKERNTFRAMYAAVRTWMGHADAKGDAKETARVHGLLAAGNYPDASGLAEAGEYKTLAATLSKSMPWSPGAPDNQELPTQTFESRLQARDKEIDALKTALAAANGQAASARADQAKAEASLAAAKKVFDDRVQKVSDDAKKDRENDRAEIARLTALVNAENEAKGAISKADADARKVIVQLTTDKQKALGERDEARKDYSKTKKELEEMSKAYVLLQEKTGKSAEEIEAGLLDSDALQTLRTWDVKRKDWRVIAMDRTGQNPYINLGSADNLQPQMTFSIHKMGPDGRLVAFPKGTLEVVRIIGPHQAQCRLTSTAKREDRERDPIIKGDYLFNPVWDPHQKRRVVLAGLADLNEDRSDATREFREMLKRQNVELGGYIDTSDDKGPPKLGGDGVNKKTDYVILGDSLEDVNHPRAKDKEFKDAFDAIVKDQREKGRSQAVPVVTLRRYLQMVGYVAPRVEKSGAPR